MIRIILIVFIFSFPFLQCGNANSQTAKQGSLVPLHPITITAAKLKDNKFELRLDLPPDYGFQIEAPHRLFLSGTNGLTVTKADLKLNGPIHPKKAEYFEYVKGLPFEVSGKGDLEVNGKLFYCNFKKNICIPGKISQKIQIL
ncbi:hypothetical protein [Leptospira ilyithenensis]|uniref:hypothetical protein n=1 Tax=Leptospira ilyithenensis TaxID=2484901 RepID=UPI001AEF39F7|nr:hypothetical protein [Leptospira ilyithenensis]